MGKSLDGVQMDRHSRLLLGRALLERHAAAEVLPQLWGVVDLGEVLVGPIEGSGPKQGRGSGWTRVGERLEAARKGL